MPHVRLRIEPSHDELAALTAGDPATEVLICDADRTADGTVVLYEIRTRATEAAIETLSGAAAVSEYQLLHEGEELLVVRCTLAEPVPYRAARSSGSLARFPIAVRDGWLVVEATATNEQLAAFAESLESAGLDYRIDRVSTTYGPGELLTDRQREVIEAAADRGYYDTPRGCTLTELAAELGIGKGTASRILHRAEGRIVSRFLEASPDG